MDLSQLLKVVPDACVRGDATRRIESITANSRTVCADSLFAAIPGTKHDGRVYIPHAIEQGAVAILTEGEVEDIPEGVTLIRVPSARRALALMSAEFFENPASQMAVIGITGTNGKTTTAYLGRHVLRSLGARVGMIGTIEYDLGGVVAPAPLTTPSAVAFSSALASMRDAEVGYVLAEFSSHALAQDRVLGHRIRCAVFTNLTRDHLDYHGSMEKYRDAKKKLFEMLDSEAVAVVNGDDPWTASLVEGCRARLILYGFGPMASLRSSEPACGLDGTTLDVTWRGKTLRVTSPLVGLPNAYNSLAALGIGLALGFDLSLTANAIRRFPGVPGRLERFGTAEVPEEGVTVFVDYAHTDDALAGVLAVLRPLTPGRLIVVFGCGGDRDRGKRPLMARAAERGAMSVILTSDNPRTEDPEQIFLDIEAGFNDPQSVERIPDRRDAIVRAITTAEAGDVVLVAGKGHEDYQILADGKHHFDDREVVAEVLASRNGGTQCA